MTTLITIAIILLFGLCVYIESNYRHTAHKTAREMDESTKSSECYYWGEDIIVGFLLTISKWLFVSILLCILFELIMGFKDIEPILYEDYKTLWWILAAIISIGFLWYFYLETLVKRSKQINFGNQMHSFGFKFAPKNSLIFMLWILFLMIVPYVTMNVLMTPYGHPTILFLLTSTKAAIRSCHKFFKKWQIQMRLFALKFDILQIVYTKPC